MRSLLLSIHLLLNFCQGKQAIIAPLPPARQLVWWNMFIQYSSNITNSLRLRWHWRRWSHAAHDTMYHITIAIAVICNAYSKRVNTNIHRRAAILLLTTTSKIAWYIISVVSVCLSDNNFWKLWCKTFIFAHLVHLRGIRVKFVHEGHRVKVQVTGAKQVENSYSRNVKLWSAITPVL